MEIALPPLGECLDRGQVDRAGPLAPAHHQQAARLGWNPESLPGRDAVGLEHRGGHRPPGHQVALSLPSRDREGEADAPRPVRQQAVGEAEVAVGLGKDEGGAGEDCAEPSRPRDEATASHDDVGLPAPDRSPCRPHRQQRLGCGARRPQWIVAIDPAHLDEVDLVPGGRHKLGLDPLAGAEEADLGAASPKLGGDRHGRHDVSGGSARRHYDFDRSCHRWFRSFCVRARVRPRRRAVCQRRRSPRGRR